MAQDKEKLSELDGLRGTAAIYVLICHLMLVLTPALDFQLASFFGLFLPTPIAKIATQLALSAKDGKFPVWVFWVMSGFVLSLSWFRLVNSGRLENGRTYIYNAAIRRYLRFAIPVAVSQVSAFSIFYFGLMHNMEISAHFGRLSNFAAEFYSFQPSVWDAAKEAVWGAFCNFEFATSYNAVLWTIEKEMWGSLFVFAFLALFGSVRSRYYAYGACLLVNFILGVHWMNAFVVGILMCDLKHNPVILAGAFWSKYSKAANFAHRVYASSLSGIVVFSSILYLVAMPDYGGIANFILSIVLCTLVLTHPSIRSMFQNRFAVYLGKISFGVYLIHWPIVMSYTCWLYLKLIDRLPEMVVVFICSISTMVISIVAGDIFYRIADKPSIRISKKFAELLTKYDNVHDQAPTTIMPK